MRTIVFACVILFCFFCLFVFFAGVLLCCGPDGRGFTVTEAHLWQAVCVAAWCLVAHSLHIHLCLVSHLCIYIYIKKTSSLFDRKAEQSQEVNYAEAHQTSVNAVNCNAVHCMYGSPVRTALVTQY